MRKRAFVVAVAATKTIRTRCEGDSGKQCHDEIRPEPQCWRGTAGFCITLLGAVLFDRDRRGPRLTAAGAVFLQDTRRLFTVLEQARENVKAVAAGLRGSLRIAVS